METDYSKAVAEFKGSARFNWLLARMQAETETPAMYLENRIMAAFDAGWCAAKNAPITRPLEKDNP